MPKKREAFLWTTRSNTGLQTQETMSQHAVLLTGSSQDEGTVMEFDKRRLASCQEAFFLRNMNLWLVVNIQE